MRGGEDPQARKGARHMADPAAEEELLSFALRLARAPRALLLDAFWRGARATSKQGDGFDPVTRADRAAEARMRQMLARRFPDHGVIGEEFGAEHVQREHVWVLDPIDGTRAFIAGLPGFSTLVALLRQGRPLLGVIHVPVMDMTLAGDGRRCWRWRGGRRAPARVGATRDIHQALAGTTLPRLYDTPTRRCVLARLQEQARHVQFDADALFYAQLASGRLDIALDTGLAAHDAAALIPVVRGAGGVISDWRGRAPDLLRARRIDLLASATPRLHARMLRLIRACGA